MARKKLARSLQTLSRVMESDNFPQKELSLKASNSALDRVFSEHEKVARLASLYAQAGSVNLTYLASERRQMDITRSALAEMERKIVSRKPN